VRGEEIEEKEKKKKKKLKKKGEDNGDEKSSRRIGNLEQGRESNKVGRKRNWFLQGSTNRFMFLEKSE